MIDIARIRRLIKSFDFDGLFEELGWDRFRRSLPIVVDGIEYQLTGIREKRGFQVFHYLVPSGSEFPTSEVMTKIQRAVAKSAHENIVVFSDESKTRQCYRIAKREDGKLLRSTGLDFHKGHSGEALAQRLSKLAISLKEEENIELVDVAKRASELFAERATKRFFTEFQRQRETFLTFIKGIKDIQQREWYSSLMLNRLMFVYFVQKKGFLDHDLDYLRNRLKRTQETKKAFHEFYRYFLIRLFHDGLNKRETDRTDPELETLLGKVPYLNGGIFDQHQIEIENTEIKIPDKAFEGLFDFFDQYTWHLDDRPLRNDQEINPDVLGYIFEKYINQKQMGAYYTKEDITEYISKNTIIPYLFEEAARRNTEPFRPEREVWQLLRDDPDRYIYDAVGHGIFVNVRTGDKLESPVTLPDNIADGITDVSKRTEWNSGAPTEVALPTETWREHIARRQRCTDLRNKLASGEVSSINDMITDNLDIRQFAQDVIDNCESPDLLRAIYYTIAGRPAQVGSNHKPQLPLSVLDPTCGSGAFLFAALNIMQPLYEACLTKMEQFIIEIDRAKPVTVDDEVAALIEMGESSTLEFKSTARFCIKLSQTVDQVPEDKQDEKWKAADKDRQHDILKAVSALLNTNGGDLVIGVDDKGVGFGIHHDYKFLGAQAKQNRDGYELWMNDLFIKQFGKIAAGCIEPVFAKRDGVDVLLLKISPSPDPVFVSKPDGSKFFYCRIGNATQHLDMLDFAKYRDQYFKGGARARKEPKLTLGTQQRAGGKKLRDFREVLAEVAKHPNRTYFVLKSIIINNLFGVDIMPEAVEICKLRLFLKLMSTVVPHYAKDNLGVEALPDIDFNIRPGNTLVGYTTLEEIHNSYRNRYELFDIAQIDNAEIKNIEKQVKIVSLSFEMFRRQQTELDGQVKEEDKKSLRQELQTLTEELDEFLAADYGVESKKPKKFMEWKKSHQPFHWFAEFYAIMNEGGFSAIIGNPPWKEYSAIKDWYTVQGYQTEPCGNLHGMCSERALTLKSENGHASFIVQLPIVCSSRMASVRSILRERSSILTIISFDDRPGKLFDGLQHCRSAIWFSHGKTGAGVELSSTRYQRWNSEAREHLFAKLEFAANIKGTIFPELFPKYDQQIQAIIFEKIKRKSRKTIFNAISPSYRKHFCFYQEATQYWVKAVYGLPFYAKNGVEGAPAHGRYIYCGDETTALVTTAVLNSSLFYSYFVAYSDCFHLSQTLVEKFPVTEKILCDAHLAVLATSLMDDLKRNADRKTIRTKDGDNIEYAEFVASKSKVAIDAIDRRLAVLYEFDAAQLEFILNYDIKYRMGGQDD
jgi:hypothetical protein